MKGTKDIHLILTPLALILWGIGLVFLLGWVFTLGVLSGRGLLTKTNQTLHDNITIDKRYDFRNLPNIFMTDKSYFIDFQISRDNLEKLIDYRFNDVNKKEVNFIHSDLICEDFFIKPITPTKQILNIERSIKWEWLLLPKKVGSKKLILTINYLKKYGEDYFPINIKTIKKEILVKMRFREKLFGFLEKHIGWISGGFITIFVVFVSHGLSKRRPVTP